MTKIIKSKHKEGRKRLTCFSRNEKSSFFYKPYKPGQHKSKLKQTKVFGILLEERAKLRFAYNVSKKKLKNLFTETSLKYKAADRVYQVMKTLSLKFDRVLFDSYFAFSIFQSSQFISHRHFLINGKKVNIKSYILKVGDVIQIVDKDSKVGAIVKENLALVEADKIPLYLDINRDTLSVTVLRNPELHEVKNIAKIDLQAALESLGR
jgi:small subunit ribosomal protein S4